MKSYSDAAIALYDGGWRAEDRDQLISEYNLTAEEAETIVEDLHDIEHDNTENG